MCMCRRQCLRVNVYQCSGLPATLTRHVIMYAHCFLHQVKLNVWYPANLTLSAADTTLNSVLPVNAAPTSVSCMDMYQSTPLTLTADWSNGGPAADDKLAAADVTDLVAFRSNDSNVVQVSGTMAKVRSDALHHLQHVHLSPTAQSADIPTSTPLT